MSKREDALPRSSPPVVGGRVRPELTRTGDLTLLLSGYSTWDSRRYNSPGQHGSADPTGGGISEPAMKSWGGGAGPAHMVSAFSPWLLSICGKGESCLCPLPSATLGRVAPEPYLGNTIELALVV